MEEIKMEEISYSGSTFLSPISDRLGIKIDQFNFVASMLFAMVLGYPFRTLLSPHHTSPLTRHLVEIVMGTAIMFFLFGESFLALLAQVFSCYMLIRFLPSRSMPVVVTAVAMLQLSAFHIWKLMNLHGKVADITIAASMMTSTQRMSMLAWSVYDGLPMNHKKLTDRHRKLAIRGMPSVLEVLSYTLNFHGVIAGPPCFFNDYIAFIDGTNLINKADKNANITKSVCPSPMWLVLHRLLVAVICSPVVLILFPAFPMYTTPDPDFLNSGFFSIWLYTIIRSATRRYKYYLAWKLVEASNNNAGFGFYYDESGQERWDLIDCVNVLKTELATNIKMFLDNWNIGTSHWLRYAFYDRVPYFKTELTFSMSMIWHGFYPGHYLTALSSSIFVITARLVRRKVRPWFITSPQKHRVYDVITTIATRLAIGYMGFPFIHIWFWVSWEIYKSLYFFFHILVFILIAIVMFLPTPEQVKKDKKKDS